jgi:hypothetical protein
VENAENATINPGTVPASSAVSRFARNVRDIVDDAGVDVPLLCRLSDMLAAEIASRSKDQEMPDAEHDELREALSCARRAIVRKRAASLVAAHARLRECDVVAAPEPH